MWTQEINSGPCLARRIREKRGQPGELVLSGGGMLGGEFMDGCFGGCFWSPVGFQGLSPHKSGKQETQTKSACVWSRERALGGAGKGYERITGY